MSQVPHLNEMYAKYKERGLVVVGVTNEETDKVERSVQKNKMRFPIARIEGTEVDAAYGVRGFPTSVLIDAEGKVVWKGHPARFNESMLTRFLGAKEDGPVPTLPTRYKEINDLLRKKQYGAAHALLVKAMERSPADRDLRRSKEGIERLLTQTWGKAQRAEADEDWLGALGLLSAIERQFTGLPKAAEAAEKRAELLRRPEVKAEQQANKLLQRVESLLKEQKREEARGAARKLLEQYPRTKCAERARQILERLG